MGYVVLDGENPAAVSVGQVAAAGAGEVGAEYEDAGVGVAVAEGSTGGSEALEWVVVGGHNPLGGGELDGVVDQVAGDHGLLARR